MSRHAWRRGACALTLVGLAAGCTTNGVGTYTSGLENVPDAEIEIEGLPDDGPSDVDILAGNAIADLNDFWTRELDEVYGEEYEPPSGGLFSVDPEDSDLSDLPCDAQPSDITMNAFYCPPDDAVAWDRAGLFPTLKEEYGPFVVAMVIAHEWGHVIQGRVGDPGRLTITSETQADCFAGAWTRATQGHHDGWHFVADQEAMDAALGGYLAFRDQVGRTDPNDRGAHGNGFDRIRAFQEGFEQGVEHCKEFSDDRQYTEFSFENSGDRGRGGNLALDQVVTTGFGDVASYWESAFAEMFEGEWKRPEVTAYDNESEDPSCGGDDVTEPVRYCAESNTIYYDEAGGISEVYDETGDFGPMALVSIAYGQAVLVQSGGDAQGLSAVMDAICLTGGYTSAAFERDGEGLVLSPGDIDEAIQAILGYADKYFHVRTSSGFVRVDAFRDGFADVSTCLE